VLAYALPFVTLFLTANTVGSSDSLTEIAGVIYAVFSFIAGLMFYATWWPRPHHRLGLIATVVFVMLLVQMILLYLDVHKGGFWSDADYYFFFVFVVAFAGLGLAIGLRPMKHEG